MSAKNGSALSVRLVGCCLAAIFAVSMFASSASASGISKTYVALGDSLAFGYSQQLYNEGEAAGDPATGFENGYTNDYLAKLKGHSHIQLVNLGCPGETSGSLIGTGPIGGALAASSFKAEPQAACGYQAAWNAFHKNGLGGPLHVPYPVGKSQLETAMQEIAVAAGSGRPVSMVTLNIGANDQLAAVHGCEKEVQTEFETTGKSKYGATPAEAFHNCLLSHVPALIEKIIKNTEAAAFAIRHGSAFGATDYAGKIVFQEGYDPYGAVVTAGTELLPGSVGLATIINGEEQAHYGESEAKGGFAPCFANPLPKFNPQTKHEPEKLQAWTNMANTSEFLGKKNGPDIHPTPAGYSELATIMKHSCGGE